jgi:hypothetical protein
VIYSHDTIRAAVARALLLDASAGLDTAINATAQVLHLSPEDVRAIVDPQEATA